MAIRKGVFVIVIDKKDNLLILHRIHNWNGWEVPKGGIDGEYSEKKALEEEMWEEVGLKKSDYTVIGKSRCSLEYAYPKNYQKKWKVKKAKFSGWLVRVKKKKISMKNNPVKEHDAYKWLPLKKALKILSFANQRKAVKNICEEFNL